ncbi:MAG TPA: signal recognition particle-docking protein FtsY [Syntrophothermus lipocalidus]|nr:signal recognition particle-docking protein FtsY [Syntrophothermus lipocalidus]
MGFFEKLRKNKRAGAPEEELTARGEHTGENLPAETANGSESPFEASDVGPQPAEPVKEGFFARLKKSLAKTRQNITEKVERLIKTSRRIDDEFFEELEEILIQADVGVSTAMELIDNLRRAVKQKKITEVDEVRGLIKQEVVSIMEGSDAPLNKAPEGPTVIMVVGVNGVGKTTTIGKLAYRFKREGKKVIIAAADTFRAAAIDQLQIWAERVGADLIKHQEGADPGAVVFDAVNAAQARRADVLIVDTAGRLHTKTNLMEEIAKVKRVIQRTYADAPHEVLLVLDATTGQNAISQANLFKQVTGVTGIVLTKLDGTAKGGIVIAIAKELDIPVKLVGIGEGLEDLRDFSAEEFAEALFSD